ncbi:MAG: ABC transporter permease [Planctomycetes bacterium]|nr:ABC transporter permease [Planctomycetota bacterium]
MALFCTRSQLHATKELIGLLTRHRQLTLMMAVRELSDRYAGQVLGLFWAIGHPIFLMVVYCFVFVVVLKLKASATGLALPMDYSVYLLAGLIPWMSCMEVLNKQSTVIVMNATLVKQVVFPVEVLPVKTALAALVMPISAFSFYCIYVFFRADGLYWTYLLIPVLLCIQTLGLIGVGYILSAIGVYFRDLKDFVQLFTFAGMYLLPIMYMPDYVPAMFKPLLYINPFSYMVWCYQDVCYYGSFEHPYAWVIFPVFSCFIFAFGYRVFRKLKPMFPSFL